MFSIKKSKPPSGGFFSFVPHRTNPYNFHTQITTFKVHWKHELETPMYLDEETPPSNAPNTNKHAKPVNYELAPPNRRCIRVKDAFYRDAVFSGVFVVADSKNPEDRNKDGIPTIEVECRWYLWKPKTRWIRITVPNPIEELSNYTGEVVRNLGQ